MGAFNDLAGQRFGRLVVVKRVGVVRPVRWECRCDCGGSTRSRASDLRGGKAQSCGCVGYEHGSGAQPTHGHARGGRTTTTYEAWSSMWKRCRGTGNALAQKNYAGRGIRVSDRWKSFEPFLEDMGERPVGASLDRIDNNGNYEPSNCRWASPKQQARNKRTNRLLTIGGKTQCMSAWAEEADVDYVLVKERIRRGWSPERAFGLAGATTS